MLSSISNERMMMSSISTSPTASVTSSATWLKTPHGVFTVDDALNEFQAALTQRIGMVTQELRACSAVIIELQRRIEQVDLEYRDMLKTVGRVAVSSTSKFARVSFGGKIAALRRDMFVNSRIRYTLFASIFKQKWHAVLPKDKDGGIFVDLDSDWVKHALTTYQANNKELDGPIDPVDPRNWRLPASRYRRGIELVAQLFCIYDQGKPANGETPFHLYDAAEMPQLGNALREVISQLDIHNTTMDEFSSALNECVKKMVDAIENKMTELINHLKFKVVESSFIRCLAIEHNFESFGCFVNKPVHWLQNFDEKYPDADATVLLNLLSENYRALVQAAAPEQQKLTTAQIIDFTVDGERVSVFRSNIISAFPDSLLAKRVAEEQWVDQADEQDAKAKKKFFGAGAFRPLINCARNWAVKGSLGEFRVDKEHVESATAILQHFGIKDLQVLLNEKSGLRSGSAESQ